MARICRPSRVHLTTAPQALTSCRKLLGDLQERARVCHGFGANEVLYKFLIEYEKKLIMEVTNFTGETIVSKLPLQIMLGVRGVWRSP